MVSIVGGRRRKLGFWLILIGLGWISWLSYESLFVKWPGWEAFLVAGGMGVGMAVIGFVACSSGFASSIDASHPPWVCPECGQEAFLRPEREDGVFYACPLMHEWRAPA